jgi:hypothetical protein
MTDFAYFLVYLGLFCTYWQIRAGIFMGVMDHFVTVLSTQLNPASPPPADKLYSRFFLRLLQFL